LNFGHFILRNYQTCELLTSKVLNVAFFCTVLMIVICLAEETSWTSVLYNFNLLLD